MQFNANEQYVNIRFFHATPMAQPVDVYINDTLIQPNLSYQQSTDYFPVLRGVYDIHLVDSATGDQLLTQRLTVNDNRYITIIAISETNQIGLLSLPDKGIKRSQLKEQKKDLSQVQPVYHEPVIEERAEVVKDMIPVRFVHLSPNAPSLSVYLNGDPIYRDLIYKEATTYMDLVPQNYSLSIRSHQTLQEIARIEPLIIQPGHAQTVYITGLLGGTPRVEAIVLPDGV